jgi:hypothetical protein
MEIASSKPLPPRNVEAINVLNELSNFEMKASAAPLWLLS